jgi:hypothetical protein
VSAAKDFEIEVDPDDHVAKQVAKPTRRKA